MTVGELIDVLRTYPANLRVVVNGYELGYDDLTPDCISVSPIALDTGKDHWEGQHGDPGDAPSGAAEPVRIVDALVLRRTSH